MKAPVEKQDALQMRGMFGTIAPRYDFITRVLSYGMDRRWKRWGVAKTSLAQNAVVLDLACGTGDFSRLVLGQRPRAEIVAADLTEPMLHQARAHGLNRVVCASASDLPFASGTFDCVFVGYGLRNFPDLGAALHEIERVTRAGGQMVSLDFFLPPNSLFRRLYLGYLFALGALWGILLHGSARFYTYIPRSLRDFVSIGELSAQLDRAGYACVKTRAYLFGGIGVHWATKK